MTAEQALTEREHRLHCTELDIEALQANFDKTSAEISKHNKVIVKLEKKYKNTASSSSNDTPCQRLHPLDAQLLEETRALINKLLQKHAESTEILKKGIAKIQNTLHPLQYNQGVLHSKLRDDTRKIVEHVVKTNRSLPETHTTVPMLQSPFTRG